MPYIKTHARSEIDEGFTPRSAGELNYAITRLCHKYWDYNGANYQAFNDILGALEGAKLELYRRRIAPYEDEKISENGDIE